MNKVLCFIISFLFNAVCALSVGLAEAAQGQVTQSKKNFVSNDLVAVIAVDDAVVINEEQLISEYVGIASRAKKFDATGINLRTGLIGVMPAYVSRMSFKDSTIEVSGISSGRNNYFGYGIRFGYERFFCKKKAQVQRKQAQAKLCFYSPSQVQLTNTKILSDRGIAALGSGIVVLNDSEIRSRILLSSKAFYNDQTNMNYSEMLRVNADHSVLEGQAEAFGAQYSFLTLQNGSKWIIPVIRKEAVSRQEKRSITERQESVLHMLVLDNSAIMFDQKKNYFKDDIYQTLHIKAPYSGGVARYVAINDANIYFNTGLNDSDKLVIEADVEGITTVHINYVEPQTEVNDTENSEKVYLKSITRGGVTFSPEGVTIVEVKGHANEDSFQLAHGYTVIGDLPYKYVLNATSSTEKGTSNILKFNFKNDYVDSEAQVKALVPQMASYLVTPNALFFAGFSDMSHQNGILADMPETLNSVGSNRRNSFFLSSYGNVVAFSSTRNPLQYGYGADMDYAALQTGIVLGSFENRNTVARVGLFGTYGQLFFTPKDMKDSAKSTLDKYSISVFSNMQHDNNLYMNTLFSYGIVKGHIKTAVINNVAKLDDTKMLNLSATIGHRLATGVKGVSFEPQAQIAYQRLMFDIILDRDNLKVNMKDPNQWLVRVGGRLTKTVPVIEKDSFISYYGKMNIIKTLKYSNAIEVGDTFYLDSMGSAIEGGLGVSMQLTKNILVHGDASYQQRLSKTGISGASFSGKLRYRF